MIIGILSFKGGVGKTTTAMNLASYFSQHGQTGLVDCDPNKSAIRWAEKGNLPFEVASEEDMIKLSTKAQYLIIDTSVRLDSDEVIKLANICNLLILPTIFDSITLDSLMATISALSNIDKNKYRILLTFCPPSQSSDLDDARKLITSQGIQTFNGQIRKSEAVAVAVQRSAFDGVLVNQQYAEDYISVGNEIMSYMSQTMKQQWSNMDNEIWNRAISGK